MQLKSCSIFGLNLNCMDCKYIFDPMGCRGFRHWFDSKIGYVELDDNLVEGIIEEYL